MAEPGFTSLSASAGLKMLPSSTKIFFSFFSSAQPCKTYFQQCKKQKEKSLEVIFFLLDTFLLFPELRTENIIFKAIITTDFRKYILNNF